LPDTLLMPGGYAFLAPFLNRRKAVLEGVHMPGGPLLPLTPPLPGMPAIATLIGMIFVYSIRDMFVCSLAKTFAHLSDRAKKIEIDKALTLERYISSIALFFIRFRPANVFSLYVLPSA
jgi:hypothetical protein